MVGPGAAAVPLPAAAQSYPYPPSVVTVPLSAVAGPPPSQTVRWPTSPR